MFVYLRPMKVELTIADKMAIRIMSKSKPDVQIATFLGVPLREIERFRFNERYKL